MRWWMFDGLTDYGVNIQEQSYRRRWLSLIRHSRGGVTVHFLIGNCLEASSACYQEPPHVASTARSPLYKVETARLDNPVLTISLVDESTLAIRDFGGQESIT